MSETSPDPDPYADPPANPFTSPEAAARSYGSSVPPAPWPPTPTPADDTQPSRYDIPAGADFSPENAEAVPPPAKPFQASGADVYAQSGAVGEDYLRHAAEQSD